MYMFKPALLKNVADAKKMHFRILINAFLSILTYAKDVEIAVFNQTALPFLRLKQNLAASAQLINQPVIKISAV